MGRVLLAALVAAVIVFSWGFLAWCVLDLYDLASNPASSPSGAFAELKNPNVLLRGLAVNFFAAVLMGAIIYAGQIKTFARRYGFVILAALFAVAATYGAQWGWSQVADRWLIVMAIDVLIAWALAGMAMAGIIKYQPEPR